MSNSFDEIQKVFVVSSGRTGTKFIGEVLEKIHKGTLSVHEPDKIRFDQKKELYDRIRKQGIVDLFVLKALGISGARNLSLHHINQSVSEKRIAKRFYSSRKWVRGKDLYVESNGQCFGLIDILAQFHNTRVAVVFRDPRDWVRFWMIKGNWYDDKDIMTRFNTLGLKRLSPSNVGVDLPEWKGYSRFQKLCWAWSFMNNRFFASLDQENVESFMFEDIFVQHKMTEIERFMRFTLGDGFNEEVFDKFSIALSNKINHNTSDAYPRWHEWSSEDSQFLQNTCGDLMNRLGYGLEKDWIS